MIFLRNADAEKKYLETSSLSSLRVSRGTLLYPLRLADCCFNGEELMLAQAVLDRLDGGGVPVLSPSGR